MDRDYNTLWDWLTSAPAYEPIVLILMGWFVYRKLYPSTAHNSSQQPPTDES